MNMITKGYINQVKATEMQMVCQENHAHNVKELIWSQIFPTAKRVDSQDDVAKNKKYVRWMPDDDLVTL